MENKFPIGFLIGLLISIPLWISAIGWVRLIASGFGFVVHGRSL
ncbi:hypothetical protein O9H85_25615 [Paenibacillus filicis]|uniref:Uncharacterized protein n=1 Tax=Paenibacillus gyeongsangnamensis TaxID=3388067 RepID=A0ABT4QFR6_9BACL|nr:hypothetical protein [Paenibacillus filicis]MCZ8515727.1 hypothetical protein [Paenibacillus filicis]